MSASSEWARRRRVAAKISDETGVRVEGLHPNSCAAYSVDCTAAFSAREARALARSLAKRDAFNDY